MSESASLALLGRIFADEIARIHSPQTAPATDYRVTVYRVTDYRVTNYRVTDYRSPRAIL